MYLSTCINTVPHNRHGLCLEKTNEDTQNLKIKGVHY